MPWTLFLDGVHCRYVLTDQYDETDYEEADQDHEEQEDKDAVGSYSNSEARTRHAKQAACPPTDDQPQLSFSKKSKK